MADALIFHRKSQLNAVAGITKESIANDNKEDLDLIKRIIASYQKSNVIGPEGSMWSQFFMTHQLDIHNILAEGNLAAATEIFRNPGSSELFYGFDILTKSLNATFDKKTIREAYAAVCLDGLVRFAEAVAAIEMDNPESWTVTGGKVYDAEFVINRIENKCWKFTNPNPFPKESGVLTSKGIISYRTPQALYQAWRAKQLLVGINEPKVLEIGGGLGRTAYYAYELGIKDYTIIDIPISAAAQGYFLGRTIGQDNVVLEGEGTSGSATKIKILNPKSFLNNIAQYDLIINADSLTEMDAATIDKYWRKIFDSAPMLMSINHEINSTTVNKVAGLSGRNFRITRFPYWLRKGYVEEIITG